MIYIWIYFTRKEKKGKIRHRKVKMEIKGRRENHGHGGTRNIWQAREKNDQPH